MVLKGFLLAVLALCASHVAALTLANSKWIWKDSGFKSVAPFVTADFRRHVTSPHGKQAVSASILIAGDSNYTLYVNGALIGQGNNWQISQQYCVGLNPINNLFAVADEHLPSKPRTPTSPAAFIAAIQIFFRDGSSETIVTDSQWLAHASTPNFFKVGFNDASWKKAFVAASANSPPFHIPASPSSCSSQSLCSAFWIWTNEVPPHDPTHNAPIGSRAFRKKLVVPGGVKARSGVIVIDADNEFSLFINGKHIGSGTDWHKKQRFIFPLNPPTSDVTIAVNATNLGGPAGLIATISLDDTDVRCTTNQFFVTDGTWKAFHSVPKGFEKPSFNDAKWPFAVVEGPYGVAPWGAV